MNEPQPTKRCAYIKYCYIAEAANCFGYKTDCVLFMVTNGESVSEERFHKAVDKLIDKIKMRMEGPPKIAEKS